jgi:hypothetical protein
MNNPPTKKLVGFGMKNGPGCVGERERTTSLKLVGLTAENIKLQGKPQAYRLVLRGKAAPYHFPQILFAL